MTTFFLVRHAAYGLLGRALVGRRLDVGLDDLGHQQAQALALRFARERVDAVQTSPRRRTRQTARPIARRLAMSAAVMPALDEIDFGEWSGRTFNALASDPAWREWNVARSTARPPGGESMVEAQLRIVAHLERMRSMHPGGRIVIVSHCDMIRATILHYRDQSLDSYDEIVLGPAAVATLVLGHTGSGLATVEEAVAA